LGRFAFPRFHDRPETRAIADDLPAHLLAVRHIGPRRARRLLDALGDDWERWVDAAPERVFATLRGIGPQQARAAADSWTASRTPLARSAPARPRRHRNPSHIG
jgi:hypothetical protein